MKEKNLQKSLAYLRDWLRYRYEREEIPGFVVAIAHKGKIIFNEAYGYANIENKEKMTTSHIFRIASHSKTFTATAIMQLQEQGKLRIDDYAVSYLPWLSKHKDKRWQKVTLRQLMSHSAGTIRDGLDSTYWSLKKPFPDAEELKKEILQTELILENNTKMKYSNYGYSLLGLVIKSVSDQEYNDYVKANIVSPLGLKQMGPEYSNSIKMKVVTGYSRKEGSNKRLPIANVDTHAMSSATGFYSTSADLCKYFDAHIQGSGKLLSDESKKEMQRIQWSASYNNNKEDYGLGFEIDYVGDRTMFGHGGGFPGQLTKTLVDPKDNLVITVMTNAIDSWVTYMAKSFVKLIDYFQNNIGTTKPSSVLYEGRYMCLWTVVDIIATGNDKYISVSPDFWEPFESPDELKLIGKDTLKILKTNNFGSEGELVKYNFGSNGRPESIIYAGDIFLPEAEYVKSIANKKIINYD